MQSDSFQPEPVDHANAIEQMGGSEQLAQTEPMEHFDNNACQAELADEQLIGQSQPTHSLLDVLRPATPPPVPKNARVIRLFDYEAAKYDTQAVESTATKPPKQESKSRAEIKAARNQSLLAAAGLM